ncbi:MAG: Type III restriction-modification system methylation subunit [Candidatus Woesebacteria bacterium]|nr:MAG: Type III restriction-modification system methylation subunit [Candidatus Woesebacteria bacterium]
MSTNDQNLSKEKLLAEIDRLKKELKKRKKYGLVWEDKPEEVFEMCKEKLPVLKEVKDKEIITDKNKPVNLLIEGDNYHALSVLNYTHAGKVDVIYIDPPYNTGNKDFIFNDNYVDREDSYRHSKWLSFMEKRLKLAKNLLKDTGVIFISIDEHELAQLKMLCDEIFTEKNLVAIFTWVRKRKPSHLDTHVRKNTEFIICYAKNLNYLLPLKSSLAEDEKPYPFYNSGNSRGVLQFPANFVKVNGLKDGIYKPDEYKDKKTLVKLLDKIEIKNGLITNSFRLEGEWRYSQKSLDELIKNKEEIVIKGRKFKPYYIRKLKGNVDELKNTMTILGATGKIKKINNPEFYEAELQIGTNEDAEQELAYMGIKFNNPKPTSLVKFLIKIATIYSGKNAIILDFFAGSGTTGNAVLELNREDNRDHKFILCTNNENNNGNGYKIAEYICYPRIKKVIEGYKNLKGEQVEGLGGNLKYFKTDFVDAEPSDKNKIRLTHQATEMLCVKEGTFEKVIDNERFKIFKNSNHYTGIIWDQTAIPEFKKVIKDIKGKISVYVFSLGDETFDEEFTDIKQKVKLSPIPEAILRMYRGIFK